MGKLKQSVGDTGNGTSAISPAVLTSIQSVIDGLDHAAVEMEHKWGVGRLRLLVPLDLRERFDRQLVLFNEAVWSADVHETRIQGAALERGWRALDQAATEAGAKPIDPVVWEVRRENGTVLGIVRDNADAHAVLADGRRMELWTLDEIVRVLDGAGKNIVAVKQEFPGAVVTDVRPATIDWSRGDEIPF